VDGTSVPVLTFPSISYQVFQDLMNLINIGIDTRSVGGKIYHHVDFFGHNHLPGKTGAEGCRKIQLFSLRKGLAEIDQHRSAYFRGPLSRVHGRSDVSTRFRLSNCTVLSEFQIAHHCTQQVIEVVTK
jgi:hypothetical protein